jgi:hypothetical protein
MDEAGKLASSRDKVRSHRERLRALGLRPVQIGVPDVRSAEFQREAHRQSMAVAASRHAEADQAWIDAASDLAIGEDRGD